jgi:lysophospholipase L1-like esterase
VGKAAAARKLASAAAYGGGGLSVLGAALYGVLRAEAKVARRTIGVLKGRVPDATGWYGRGRPGPAIKIALLGDSSAAGYGVDKVEETPGALLGSGVAAGADRRVHLREFCVSGAKSIQLAEQVDVALLTEPDVAVILIGANDVTNQTRPSESVRYLSEAVRRLLEADIAVVVGTCPDLGTVRPIPQPLRQIARTWSRRLAAAQAIAVVEEGGRAVSAIIGAGVVPAAIEMMDALAIEAAEAAVACDYPVGAGAVLIVELDGPSAEVEHQFAQVKALCSEAFEQRTAQNDAERARIWRGRTSAFAAVGRISPAYIVQDGVIPRTALPGVLARIDALSQASGVRVANVFHAGDGNLHPLVLFDDAVPGQGERAEELSGQILDLCIEHGGSITGEHGVGVDKSRYMPKMFSADDLDTMQLVRCAFDPRGLSNPGKVFPTPRLCGEVPGVRKGVHPLVESGKAEQF